MAITKILNIGENKVQKHSHLRSALAYICNPDKTEGGRFVGAVGCQPMYAIEQMLDTKKQFAKEDKRQGYHIIISFEEGEIDGKTAFEFMGRFTDEYLKGEYEAVYSVHTDTAHIHGHVIFNSVNKKTGGKFRYEKGDWQKFIQPITNRLCAEYGLSTIDLTDEIGRTRNSSVSLNRSDGSKLVWSDMIRRDIDAAVIRATDFDSFLMILEDMGYEIKIGKYLSLRPPGMTRFRRTQTLGEQYSTDVLKNRIETETLRTYEGHEPTILRVNIPYHLKRAKLTGIQKKYFKKLYETGKLKRKPYSEAWKYKDDIKLFNKLQAEYLFLAKYEIHTEDDLKKMADILTAKKKERNREKSKIYKQRARFKPLFEIVERLDQITPAEESYQAGDSFFEDEHLEYERLKKELLLQGYTVKDIKEMDEHFKVLLKEHGEKYKGLSKDVRIFNQMMKEPLSKDRQVSKEKTKDKIKLRTR
ncbi:MAG: relaxase/mobilization nuclease domain-containing protein [Lachnospiraceae bacterium]|nr:relaxase/mobilization nuclease domain-containing protein [Lachnospiraceae bacterium]